MLQTLGQALGPASVHTHPPKGKRKKSMREKEREGRTKKGGLYKKLQIPTLPPKHARSGVTFHYLQPLLLKPSLSDWLRVRTCLN